MGSISLWNTFGAAYEYFFHFILLYNLLKAISSQYTKVFKAFFFKMLQQLGLSSILFPLVYRGFLSVVNFFFFFLIFSEQWLLLDQFCNCSHKL